MKKNVLVTGGNSGIGYATAKLFRDKGYEVFISGRNSAKVAVAAAELEVQSVIANMEIFADIEELASHFLDTGLDVLVNNAATAKFAPITMHTGDDYSSFYNTNLRGPLYLIQKLVPSLTKRKGSIVNISSVIVNNGLPNASLYAATKGGIDAFTRSLAIELAPMSIQVNTVSPGAIDTPIVTKLGLPQETIDAIRTQTEANIPMGRYGLPEEVAHVVLAQAEATYVTGSIWNVDGGVDAC